jgi:DNA-directed RNA polymerase specialized sigma24 family protein
MMEMTLVAATLLQHLKVELAVGEGEAQPVALNPDDLLALDDALSKLAEEDPPAAEVVKLRLYAGLSVEEAAEALCLSRAQAYRHWTYARAWLRAALQEDAAEEP